MEGRAWNEAYLLHAFLQFNTAYQIIFFNSYLHCAHRKAISTRLPLTARNPGGSLWLQKVRDKPREALLVGWKKWIFGGIYRFSTLRRDRFSIDRKT
jgi:hypothetical protein